MNQSLPWSLLASTALALLLMTPVSTHQSGARVTTFATVVAALQQSVEALREAAEHNRPAMPEAATLALLIGGLTGAWCVHRRTAPSGSGGVRTRR